MCAGVQPGRVGVPFLAALGRLDGPGRVRALLPGLGALPVGDVRRVKLQRGEMLALRPRQRPAILAPHGGARRNVYRQVRRVKQVPA